MTNGQFRALMVAMRKLNHLLATGIMALGLTGSCTKEESKPDDPRIEILMKEYRKTSEQLSKARNEIYKGTLMDANRKALTVPCDAKALDYIDKIRKRLVSVLPVIQKKVEADCASRTDCPNDASFWTNLAKTINAAYVFCPIKGPEELKGDIVGSVVYPADEKYPGSYAIVEERFKSPCVIAEIIAHESTHLSTHTVHITGKEEQTDFIYLIGQRTEEECFAGLNK